MPIYILPFCSSKGKWMFSGCKRFENISVVECEPGGTNGPIEPNESSMFDEPSEP